jgi:addiction module RelE/StbE family toxin
MAKIIWTERALKDLEEIGSYISKNSEKYASYTLNKIIATALSIEKNTNIGRAVPELNNHTIRELISGSYRIIYQIRDVNFIFILTIFHSARHLTSNFFE